VAGGALERVSDADRGGLDAPDPVYDPQRRRMAYVRNGDVFVRDLATGALTQLTRTAQAEAQVRFAADGGVLWRVGNDWFHWSPGGVAAQVVALKAERDPAAPPAPDALRRSEEHTSELQSRENLVCRLLLAKK